MTSPASRTYGIDEETPAQVHPDTSYMYLGYEGRVNVQPSLHPIPLRPHWDSDTPRERRSRQLGENRRAGARSLPRN